MLRGAPTNVASSTPIMITTRKFPSNAFARGVPLNNGTAHSIPETPRTRYRSSSVRAFTSSKYCVLRSITQRLASGTSIIWLVVRRMIPAKIELWCDIRKVEKATAKIRPRYLARSPRSICSATKFIRKPLFLNRLLDVNGVHQDPNFFGIFSSLANPLDENVHNAVDQAIWL